MQDAVENKRNQSSGYLPPDEEESNQTKFKNKENLTEPGRARHTKTTSTDVTSFLHSFREKGSHFISSAYLMSSQGSIETSTIDGTLFTSLAGDVFTLVHSLLTLLEEFISSANLTMTDTGDAVIADALLSIFRMIFCKQIHYGGTSLFIHDVDLCIARANDYWRMVEETNSTMQNVSKQNSNHLAWDVDESSGNLLEWNNTARLVTEEASNLIDQLNMDAVQASHHAAICIIQEIQRLDIPRELFSKHWEEDLTNNEVAKYIVRVYDGYLADIKHSLVSDYLYHKVVVTLIRSTICFYLRCFILKADKIRRSSRWGSNDKARKGFFRSPKRVLLRITHDIQVFRSFFRTVSDGSTTLQKIVSNELSVLSLLILEFSDYAACRDSQDSLEQFIIVIHKRTGADPDITRHFVSDVFLLMSERDINSSIRDTIRKMTSDLDRIKDRVEGTRIDDNTTARSRNDASAVYFQLDEMLKAVYKDRLLQESLVLCGNGLVTKKA
eukprot:CAMPEP_0201122446 /NCGR_PEP_ID=MMETSP0850-20130426/6096_1 /ASSEMBLY_ACC=CAM_ASM_000622 /TAXON_ID=183588 /ORGANISM="Pseudo-nitzschia fraudulenta, Strain WWA7" /LENGTH=497 /DNA_ID=CAMNT_0047389149 /DNA_START=125 /DNA_END=1618 /DNA_ORIENTATION=+